MQDTLHAAMVDEDAAAAVRSGMLVTALAATGVGKADVVDAVAVPAAIGMTPAAARRCRPRARPGCRVVPDPEPAPDEEKAGAGRPRLAAAQQAVDAAAVARPTRPGRRSRKAHKRRSRRSQARTLQAAEELEEARRRVAELEHEIEILDEEAAATEHKVERARSAVRRRAGRARERPGRTSPQRLDASRALTSGSQAPRRAATTIGPPSPSGSRSTRIS